MIREKKSNLIILGKNRNRIDCVCRFDLTQVNTINFLKEWINPLYFEKNVINYNKKKFLQKTMKKEYNLNQDKNSANKENSQDFSINKSRWIWKILNTFQLYLFQFF